MRVFAQEEGLAADVPVKVFRADLFRGGIHAALNVNIVTFHLIANLFVGLVFQISEQTVIVAACAVLAVYKASRQAVAEILCHGTVVFAYAGFVADAPDQDGRVVFIPFDHACGTVDISLAPLWAVCQLVPISDHCHAVRFQIRFIDQIKAETVAKSGEPRVVRIVAGAYGVDIVALHNHQVFNHVFRRRGSPQIAVTVMTVDAFEFDFLSVQVEHSAAHLDFSESGTQTDIFVSAVQEQCVQRRIFIGPERGAVDQKIKSAFPIDFQTAGRNLHAVRLQQTVLDQRLPVQTNGRGAGAGTQRFIERRNGFDIRDVNPVAE